MVGKAESYVKTGETEASILLLEKLQSTKPIPVQQTIIQDCTSDNDLVVDGKVRLFIYVSGMTVGDPWNDESLAISRFVNNDEYKKAFYEAYKRYNVSKQEFECFDNDYMNF